MNLTPEEQRIRQALEQIETPSYDIYHAVQAQRMARIRRMPLRSPLHAIVAVAIVLTLTITAATAIGLSVGWHTIFGAQAEVPEKLAIPLQEGQEIDGYILTIEDAILTSTDVAVILSVRNANDVPFEQPVCFDNISLMVEDETQTAEPRSQNVSFRQGKPVQYLYCEFELPVDPEEHTLILQADPIWQEHCQPETTATLPLADIWNAKPLTFNSSDPADVRLAGYQAQGESILLPDTDEISFVGISQQQDGLCLAFTMPSTFSPDSTTVEVTGLLDTRTGETISCDSSSAESLSNNDGDLCEYFFPSLSAEDLPYLQPVVQYTTRTALTSKPWSISFHAPRMLSREQQTHLVLDNDTVIQSFTLSPLGLQLSGEGHATDTDFPSLAPDTLTLTMRDGSVVRAVCISHSTATDGESNISRFQAQYEFQTGSAGRRFLPVDEVSTIRFGRQTLRIAE